MSKIYRDFMENVKTWYTIEIKDNEASLILDSLEYKCVSCDKAQYTDLSLVPVGRIVVKCCSCNKRIVVLDDEDFSIRLIPEDEAYDHVPLIGMMG